MMFIQSLINSSFLSKLFSCILADMPFMLVFFVFGYYCATLMPFLIIKKFKEKIILRYIFIFLIIPIFLLSLIFFLIFGMINSNNIPPVFDRIGYSIFYYPLFTYLGLVFKFIRIFKNEVNKNFFTNFIFIFIIFSGFLTLGYKHRDATKDEIDLCVYKINKTIMKKEQLEDLCKYSIPRERLKLNY